MEILKHNWKWKLASFIIGILLWSYITAGVNPSQSTTISNIAVAFENQDSLADRNLQITHYEPNKLTVNVVGKRSALANLQNKDIVASIDARDLTEGEQTVTINYNVPSAVLIGATSDTSISIVVEKVVQEDRPVVVTTTGTLDSNYILEKLTTTPESITVSGPKSKVNQVTELRVMLDQSTLNRDTSSNLQVVPVDAEGKEVTDVKLSLSSVNVAASISKQKSVPLEMTLKGTALPTISIQDIKLTPKTVLIKGPVADIDAITVIKTKPLDRASVTKEGTYSIGLEFPEGIRPVNEEDRTVQADISIQVTEPPASPAEPVSP